METNVTQQGTDTNQVQTLEAHIKEDLLLKQYVKDIILAKENNDVQQVRDLFVQASTYLDDVAKMSQIYPSIYDLEDADPHAQAVGTAKNSYNKFFSELSTWELGYNNSSDRQTRTTINKIFESYYVASSKEILACHDMDDNADVKYIYESSAYTDCSVLNKESVRAKERLSHFLPQTNLAETKPTTVPIKPLNIYGDAFITLGYGGVLEINVAMQVSARYLLRISGNTDLSLSAGGGLKVGGGKNTSDGYQSVEFNVVPYTTGAIGLQINKQHSLDIVLQGKLGGVIDNKYAFVPRDTQDQELLSHNTNRNVFAALELQECIDDIVCFTQGVTNSGALYAGVGFRAKIVEIDLSKKNKK